MKVTGVVKRMTGVEEISDKFSKATLVVETEDQYPQVLAIEFVNDKIDLLAELDKGHRVEVDINLRGREWKAPDGAIKYFTTLQGWRINILDVAAPAQQAAPLKAEDPADDLPF